MIWRKQGTSPNRLLCFSDVMFTCQGKLGEFMPASKLAGTFVLALIEEKSTPLNFSYFSTQLSLKILAKQSKTAKKRLAFSLLNYSTWRKQGTSPNRLLCFSDVMFTCQGKLGKFMAASTILLALVEEKSTPLNFLYFSTQLPLKILAKQRKTASKCLHFTVELFNLVYFALVPVTR